MMRIVVKHQFAGIHCWANCDIPEVEFLKFPHRHMFHVTVKIPVNHNDRDLEFFMVKNGLVNIICKLYPIMNGSDNIHQLGSKSCEMIIRDIIGEFQKTYGNGIFGMVVSVFEDDENGAEFELV